MQKGKNLQTIYIMYLVINLTDDYSKAEIIKNEKGNNLVFSEWNEALKEYSKYVDAVIVDTTG